MSARLSAKLAAWKAPRLQPSVATSVAPVLPPGDDPPGSPRVPAVRADPWHDVVENPRLVTAVQARPLLDWDGCVRPGLRVVAVDAVKLQPSRVEQVCHGIDHAVALEVRRPAPLGGEYEHGAAPMAVTDYRA